MSDLSDDLRTTIDGAAAPVTFEEVIDRTPAGRRGRSRGRAIVTTAVVVASIAIGAVVVANVGGDGGDSSRPHVAAPSVAVGDIDLAVLSTSFDEDGARGPLGADIVDAVRGVAGVSAAQGAMQRFVEVVPAGTLTSDQPTASERSAIAISWEDGVPFQFSAGGPPAQPGEIAINQSLATRYGIGVGAELSVRSGPMGAMRSDASTAPTARVVGVFTPAGGDVDGLNLVVLRADDLASVTGRSTFDRVDIVAAAGVPIDQLLDRVAAALPAGSMVVPPSVVGFDEQLRAELEIQRAYHWILEPDLAHRQQSTDASPDDAAAAQNQQNYDRNLGQIVDTELRVSRVSFVDNATALVTYRAYYAGHPSTVAPNPMTGVVQKVDGQWRIGMRGLCELATLSKLTCNPGNGPDASTLAGPPNGWNPVDSVPGAADAIRVLGDPASTVEQRIAVVENGDALRPVIAAGVAADAHRAGQVSLQVVAARLLDPTHAQVLTSVVAQGEPHLETPYPLVSNLVLVDGSWRAVSRFACGLSALAAVTCPPVSSVPTSTSTPPSSTRPATTLPAPATSLPPATEGPVTTVTPTTIPTTTATTTTTTP